MKKQFSSIPFFASAGLVLLFVGIAGAFWIQKVRQNAITMTRFPVIVTDLREIEKKYTITGEYPTFSDELKPLNNVVEKTVQDVLGEFIKTATTNWDERMQTAQSDAEKPKDPFQCMVSWTPQQMNPQYVSFVIHIDAYTGGANMNSDVITFNYDVKNKKHLTLVELYPNQKDMLSAIATYAKEDLKSQHAEEIAKGEFPLDILEEGVKPIEENYSRFTFDENFVTLYFPKYQVAPGTYGEQKVMVPRALTSVN